MPFVFFFQAEDGIRDIGVTGVQTCALPISLDLDSAPAGYRTAADIGCLHNRRGGGIRQVGSQGSSSARQSGRARDQGGVSHQGGASAGCSVLFCRQVRSEEHTSELQSRQYL